MLFLVLPLLLVTTNQILSLPPLFIKVLLGEEEGEVNDKRFFLIIIRCWMV